MLRELGITLFLTCVGLNAGIRFVDVLVNGDGFVYMGLAAFITFVRLRPSRSSVASCSIELSLAHRRHRGFHDGSSGAAFANGITASDAANVAYASVYPLTMLLRIFAGQMLAIALFLPTRQM